MDREGRNADLSSIKSSIILRMPIPQETVHTAQTSSPTISGERLLAALYAERSSLFAYGLGAALALLVLFSMYPLSFLRGEGEYFETSDVAANVTGWLFYVRDTWHFPLLHTERLNFPAGVSIAFTDSIPFAALLFKTFAAWLPDGFHYFGWWHALIFFSQSVAAVMLIRALGLRHALAVPVAVVFALVWPALLHRFWHTALMTHSFILFSLALYFLGRSGQIASRTAAVILACLCVLAMIVHPYLLALCYAIFIAYLADQALSGEGWKRQLMPFIGSLTGVALAAFALGYLARGGNFADGFGVYSMNLLSPFCGGRLALCSGMRDTQQGEGLNYFGLGLLLMLPFAIASVSLRMRELLRRYPVLLLVLVMLSAYAFSNRVYWGSYNVLSYDLPSIFNPLIGTFRASGRFFWPVGYLILFATLAAILKRPSWRSVILALTAVSLQWFDTMPARNYIDQAAAKPGKGDLISWKTIMQSIDHLDLYPIYGCGNIDPEKYLFYQRLAAVYGKTMNTGYIARPNTDCIRSAQEFGNAPAPRHLFVGITPFDLPKGFLTAAQQGGCASLYDQMLCGALGDIPWKQSNLPFGPGSAALRSSIAWNGDELLGLVGQAANGGRTAQSARGDAAGFLSYGPYLSVGPGRYHFTLQYRSDGAPGQEAGWWDVLAHGAGPQAERQLMTGKLEGSTDEERVIEGDFDIVAPGTSVEIRTFFSGVGKLEVRKITLNRFQGEVR